MKTSVLASSFLVVVSCKLCFASFLVMPANGNSPSPEKIVGMAIKEQGGRENLEKFQSFQVKGKGTIMEKGRKVPFDFSIWFLSPGKLRQELTSTQGAKITVIRVFDGKEAWEKIAQNKTQKLSQQKSREYESACVDHQILKLYPLLDPKDVRLTLRGKAKVKGKEAWVVEILFKKSTKSILYFDIENKLLVKIRGLTNRSKEKEEILEDFFEKYQSWQGAKFPAKITTLMDGKDYLEREILEVAPLRNPDPKLFSAPE
jgi:hypothetical protein